MIKLYNRKKEKWDIFKNPVAGTQNGNLSSYMQNKMKQNNKTWFTIYTLKRKRDKVMHKINWKNKQKYSKTEINYYAVWRIYPYLHNIHW